MRTRTEYRRTLHTIDGDTELIDIPVEVPDPRDWDHIALTAATIGAAALVLAAIANATAGTGDLLARAAPDAVAYSVAAAFDLAWIICMLLEWTARYDPDRAQLPRRAGYVALAVAMVVLCTHGWKEDSFAVGAATAAVSAVAKSVWTLVIRAHARPLDPHTALWLRKRESRLSARAALAAQLRHLDRIEAPATLRTPPESTPEIAPEHPEGPGTSPDGAPQPPSSGPMTMADAVRTALQCGINESDAVLRYVRKVHDVNAKEESVLRTLRMARRAS